jgi:hypothetical protein
MEPDCSSSPLNARKDLTVGGSDEEHEVQDWGRAFILAMAAARAAIAADYPSNDQNGSVLGRR